MAIAVYARKSKLSEAGESVENQIRLCKEYAAAHWGTGEESFAVYQDEGFSGKSAKRPAFQAMLGDIREGKIGTLLCYRLDRVSRSVSDFSELLSELSAREVGFVSLRESFDTTTPIGRAMVYIASVFAQLERETIAERVADNLLSLARTRRYLGSNPPFGYAKQEIFRRDERGNLKRWNGLALDPEEAEVVRRIYGEYLQGKNIKGIEEGLRADGHRTRQGNPFGRMAIRRMLAHPIYATADSDTYRYFQSLGAEMVSPLLEFDGRWGIYIYRRTKWMGQGVYLTPPQQWIVGVGNCPPMMEGKSWLQVQTLLAGKPSTSRRRAESGVGLLTGLLRCGSCGSPMRPFSVSGERFYYVCVEKESSRKARCSLPNLRGDLLDRQLWAAVTEIGGDGGEIARLLKEGEATGKAVEEKNSFAPYRRMLVQNEKAIQNLIRRLAAAEKEGILSYVAEEIKRLEKENQSLRERLGQEKNQRVEEEAREAGEPSREEIEERIKGILRGDVGLAAKREYLRSLLDEVVWDGKEIMIRYQCFGT